MMSQAMLSGLHWATMEAAHLPAVCALERRAHAHPWSERQFLEALQAGHSAQLLLCRPATNSATAPAPNLSSPAFTLPDCRLLLGYCVAQTVLDEVHLHNLASARPRQGWGHLMLQHLIDSAQSQGAQTLWLEVRASNQAALALYQRAGFEAVATRRGYYPAAGQAREDALVLRRCLQALTLAASPTEPEPA